MMRPALRFILTMSSKSVARLSKKCDYLAPPHHERTTAIQSSQRNGKQRRQSGTSPQVTMNTPFKRGSCVAC